MRSCPRDLVSRADYLRRTLTSVYDNMGKNTPTVYISQVPHTPRPCTRAQLSSPPRAAQSVRSRTCASSGDWFHSARHEQAELHHTRLVSESGTSL